MKKFILAALALFLTVLTVSAQTGDPKFKGITVAGDASVFVDKLKDVGFTYVAEGDGLYLLDGSFAGFDDCQAIVYYTPTDKTVAKVTVLTTVYSSWRTMYSDYNELKRVYEQKYGHPDSDYHFFSPPYELGDGYETTAVKLNKCHYLTVWHVGGYTLGLKITQDMKISIGYENDDGMQALIAAKESDRINDI